MGLCYDLSGEGSLKPSPINMNLIVPNDIGHEASDSSFDGDNEYVVAHTNFSDCGNESDVEGEGQLIAPSTPRERKTWIRHTTYGITKVAKGVKTGTIKSGNLIGKAVTHTIKGHGLHPRRKYLREKPKQTKKKRKSRDHHIAVNKALRNTRRNSSTYVPSSIMAGQLKAPDQSCRTVSSVLSKLSSSPSFPAKVLLSTYLSSLSDLDFSFLSGGTVEVRHCGFIMLFYLADALIHVSTFSILIAWGGAGLFWERRSYWRVCCGKSIMGQSLARGGVHCS